MIHIPKIFDQHTSSFPPKNTIFFILQVMFPKMHAHKFSYYIQPKFSGILSTQSTNPLFRFVQYFLSLYFSRMNAMVYVNKINVFQKYGKFGNVPTTSGHFIKHLYLLFLNSDPYVHSIKWENI